MKTITYEEWIEQYKPIQNTIVENPNMDGMMFETYDEEAAKVFSHNRKQVWTWITGDCETDWLVPGICIVNRMGYFITEKEWEDENIEIDMNDKINIGEAKYACVDFIEQEMGLELTDEQEDALHNFWSQIL